MAEERMQTGRGIKPVVGSPRLPRMTEAPPPAILIGGKNLLMPAKPKASPKKRPATMPTRPGIRPCA